MWLQQAMQCTQSSSQHLIQCTHQHVIINTQGKRTRTSNTCPLASTMHERRTAVTAAAPGGSCTTLTLPPGDTMNTRAGDVRAVVACGVAAATRDSVRAAAVMIAVPVRDTLASAVAVAVVAVCVAARIGVAVASVASLLVCCGGGDGSKSSSIGASARVPLLSNACAWCVPLWGVLCVPLLCAVSRRNGPRSGLRNSTSLSTSSILYTF
jgi:hypothetical protein